jgi:hypothetical protein
MGQSKWLIAEKKEFSRFGDIVILICEAVWGCGVGRGGYLEYKILHRKFAICQYFRDSEPKQTTLVK